MLLTRERLEDASDSAEKIAYSTFLRNEQPSVRRARPPVGWQRTLEHEEQTTTVEACENTVVLRKRKTQVAGEDMEQESRQSCVTEMRDTI